MPILGVCGDSFMSATLNTDHAPCQESEGKHFTEILAKKINYDYFTLARGACSNFAIRLQISEMIKQKVDLIIVGTTTSNRVEIPNIGKKFDQELGVYNLDYRTEYYPDRSTLNTNFKHHIISDTLTNIFTDTRPLFKKIFNLKQTNFLPPISQDQIYALQGYLNYLFDDNYKNIIDTFIIQSGIKSLEDSKIPYIVILMGLNSNTLYTNLFSTNDYRFIVESSPLNPYSWGTGDRRWHTSDLAQKQGADLWYDYLIENKIVKIN